MWVKRGVHLPWRRVPRPTIRPQKVLTDDECVWLDAAVKEMISAGAIYETKAENLILSSIYPVVKKDSDKRRPVINLRWVNEHLHTAHFKMSTMKDVKAAIIEKCFMAKIDLKECFWQMPVAKKHQRFLSFHWRGKNYSFQCLPFGLSVAPLIITRGFLFYF